MLQSMSLWQGASVLIGVICVANGILLTGMSPKKAMIEFAGISQMVLGVALTFFPFIFGF